ncbi:MAG TPA: hypothetical protein PKM08_00945 [Syntrophorhabdaceae bacterium]|nr:hypothetical protein [Syntrophorhabdaceae bacterium]
MISWFIKYPSDFETEVTAFPVPMERASLRPDAVVASSDPPPPAAGIFLIPFTISSRGPAEQTADAIIKILKNNKQIHFFTVTSYGLLQVF